MILLSLLLALAPTPDARLLEGERLYADLEFEQAIVTLQDALVDGAALAPQKRARALLFLGLSQAQIGKSEPARQSFTAAFRADNDVLLPESVPPKIQPLIDEARAEAARAGTEPAPSEPTVPIVPVVVGVAGGALVIGGGIAAALSLAQWAEATDAATTQRNAKELGDEANTLMTIAAIVGGVGIVTTGVAVALAFVE